MLLRYVWFRKIKSFLRIIFKTKIGEILRVTKNLITGSDLLWFLIHYINLCPFRALGMNLIGLIFIVLLCVMDGCVIYAVYSKCDIGKFGMGKVTSNDQVQRLIIFIYLLFDKLSILRISVCFFRLIPLDFQSILPWPSGNFSLKLWYTSLEVQDVQKTFIRHIHCAQ